MGVVIAAAITGLLSLLGVIITVIAGNRKITVKMEIAQAVTQEQLKNTQEQLKNTQEQIRYLGDEVHRHNNFAQRMPVVEEKVCNIERRLDVLETERRAQ